MPNFKQRIKEARAKVRAEKAIEREGGDPARIRRLWERLNESERAEFLVWTGLWSGRPADEPPGRPQDGS